MLIYALKNYGLPFLMAFSLFAIYVNMLHFIPDKAGFLYVDEVINGRHYFYKLGIRFSFCVIFFVIFTISSENIKWTSFLLLLYWFIEIVEFVGWYNTTPKWGHWWVLFGLWTTGIFYNEATGRQHKRRNTQPENPGENPGKGLRKERGRGFGKGSAGRDNTT